MVNNIDKKRVKIQSGMRWEEDFDENPFIDGVKIWRWGKNRSRDGVRKWKSPPVKDDDRDWGNYDNMPPGEVLWATVYDHHNWDWDVAKNVIKVSREP